MCRAVCVRQVGWQDEGEEPVLSVFEAEEEGGAERGGEEGAEGERGSVDVLCKYCGLVIILVDFETIGLKSLSVSSRC
jgi:hypothetical protein